MLSGKNRMMSDGSVDGGLGGVRVSERRVKDTPTIARTVEGDPYDIHVTDLSREGCRFKSDQPIAIGSNVRIGLSGAGSATCEVVWHRDGHYGCRFHAPLDDTDLGQAFSGPTVLHIRAPAEFLPAPVEIGKYPTRTRALIFIGGAAVLWTAVIAAIVLAV
jgi:hypothetical protein